MGTLSLPIEIGNPEGTHYETIRALVDTGASYTTVPAPSLRDMGVSVHDQLTFILADGGASDEMWAGLGFELTESPKSL